MRNTFRLRCLQTMAGIIAACGLGACATSPSSSTPVDTLDRLGFGTTHVRRAVVTYAGTPRGVTVSAAEFPTLWNALVEAAPSRGGTIAPVYQVTLFNGSAWRDGRLDIRVGPNGECSLKRGDAFLSSRFHCSALWDFTHRVLPPPAE